MSLTPHDPASTVREVADAALDALTEALSLDLRALLVVEPNLGPQLHMDRPDLTSIGPNDAFALFSALRQALDGGEEFRQVELAGFHVALIVMTDGQNRGLLAIGRRGSGFTGPESTAIERFAAAYSRLHHQGEHPVRPPARPEVVRLSIESSRENSLAAVTLSAEGQLLRGAAEDPSPLRAVGEATLAALGETAEGMKLSAVTEGEIGVTRVVLSLVLDQRGRAMVGACPLDGTPDALHAAVDATLRAAFDL